MDEWTCGKQRSEHWTVLNERVVKTMMNDKVDSNDWRVRMDDERMECIKDDKIVINERAEREE